MSAMFIEASGSSELMDPEWAWESFKKCFAYVDIFEANDFALRVFVLLKFLLNILFNYTAKLSLYDMKFFYMFGIFNIAFKYIHHKNNRI